MCVCKLLCHLLACASLARFCYKIRFGLKLVCGFLLDDMGGVSEGNGGSFVMCYGGVLVGWQGWQGSTVGFLLKIDEVVSCKG